jgi:serine/threonine protein kinase
MSFRALIGNKDNCIELFGITELKLGDQKEGLFLVFELATERSLIQSTHILREYSWDELINLFVGIAEGVQSLHARGIAHGYPKSKDSMLIGRDLHEGNVLLKKRFFGGDVRRPETIDAALIDFGRARADSVGTTTGDLIAQDVYNYGALLRDQALDWMVNTGQEEIPITLVEAIKKCLCEEGYSMRELIRILEVFGTQQPGEEMVPMTTALQAWQEHESRYASTRSRPSATGSEMMQLSGESLY